MTENRKFKEALIEDLKNLAEADAYLEVALEEYERDRNTEAFLMAMRHVAEAQGGFTKLAERTQLNREHLYRVLSGRGNPRLETLDTILHGLGFRLAIRTLAPHV